MLLKGKYVTLYYNDEGERVQEKTENFIKLKSNITYKQANMLYEIISQPKFKSLFGGGKIKENDQADALVDLIPYFMKLLSTAIVDWSAVDDKGKKLPVTIETLEDLENNIVLDLINEIMAIFSNVQSRAQQAEDEVKN